MHLDSSIERRGVENTSPMSKNSRSPNKNKSQTPSKKSSSRKKTPAILSIQKLKESMEKIDQETNRTAHVSERHWEDPPINASSRLSVSIDGKQTSA